MARFTVGCVPYVNAIPLVYPLRQLGGDSPVEVVYDVPSRLPALLESGAVQAVLVSIYDPLTVPGRTLAAGVCIGSDGPVQSVRLFSKKPFERIESLALDASSMTSNALAQIILRESYGATPLAAPAPPDLRTMLEEHDACVLIGDAGMSASGEGLHVADLGEEWKRLTEMPFVWAAWVGSESLDVELSEFLRAAFFDPERFGVISTIDEWVTVAATTSGFSRGRLQDYFANAMRYALDEAAMQGVERFGQYLSDGGIETLSPRVVSETAAI